MGNGFAIVKSDKNSKAIGQNADNIALTLTFLDDFGPALIWGRVGLQNVDGDPQNAAAWLVWNRDVIGEAPVELDRTEVRLGARDDAHEMSVSLQAWVTVKTGHVIELHCATYDGFWLKASLIALGIIEWGLST